MGRQLVHAAERWARTRSLPGLVVRSHVARAASDPSYRGLGDQPTKTQHVYRRPLATAPRPDPL